VLVARTLGGGREDTISALAIVLGTERATSLVSGLEAHIRAEAKTGAEEAIPAIRAEVKSSVRPYVIAAMILGGVGAVASGYAIYRSVRK